MALLGSATFDISRIDPSTVSLDGAPVKIKGKSGKNGSYEDVNLDGFTDLVVQIVDLGIYPVGSTTVNLFAETLSGDPVYSSKEICITH